jgi:hypothetical protein
MNRLDLYPTVEGLTKAAIFPIDNISCKGKTWACAAQHQSDGIYTIRG